jgi:ubiquinone biosynthesis monooxygenase Coq7
MLDKLLSSIQKQFLTPHSGRLMRVNHSGEVCAQALYLAKKHFCSDPELKTYFANCTEEEKEHLELCANRLKQLNTNPSLLDPIWFLGSYALAAIITKIDLKLSLGFMNATEEQVAEHLEDHLSEIDANDHDSINIIKKMLADELEHADNAIRKGGKDLRYLKPYMKQLAKVMTISAKYI